MNSIKHSGIFGQRWFHRRYQNPDGTYTEEGLIRKREARLEAAKRQVKVNKLKVKYSSILTDDELTTLSKRLDAEKRLRETAGKLYGETKSDSLSSVLKASAVSLLKAGAASGTIALGQMAISKLVGRLGFGEEDSKMLANTAKSFLQSATSKAFNLDKVNIDNKNNKNNKNKNNKNDNENEE